MSARHGRVFSVLMYSGAIKPIQQQTPDRWFSCRRSIEPHKRYSQCITTAFEFNSFESIAFHLDIVSVFFVRFAIRIVHKCSRYHLTTIDNRLLWSLTSIQLQTHYRQCSDKTAMFALLTIWEREKKTKLKTKTKPFSSV